MVVSVGVFLVVLVGIGGGVVAVVSQACDSNGGGGGSVAVGPITRTAKREVPTRKTSPSVVTLSTLVRLSDRQNIDWHFVASIAKQECDFGRCPGVADVNYAGCIGPMQLGVGGACGDFFGRNKRDGDGDGQINPIDAEDAVASSINGLKREKGAPGKGGSYQEYRQAACGYYGACADGLVNYADEVMARAVAYGFEGPGAPSSGSAGAKVQANAAPATPPADCSQTSTVSAGPAELEKAITLRAPRAFKLLPQKYMGAGRPRQPVDSRIYPNVIWVLETYDLAVTAAREPGHNTHGDGTAIDAVPAKGGSQAEWDRTALKAAHALGWREPCGGSGGRPACPLVPAIHWIGYEGYPNHGSPKTCSGGCPAHIHISWESDTYGTGAPGPPPGWVKVFPSPGIDDDSEDTTLAATGAARAA